MRCRPRSYAGSSVEPFGRTSPTSGVWIQAVLDAVTTLQRALHDLEQRVLQLERSGRQAERER